MTDTIRVYDLAKELKLTNKEVIEKLETKLGIKVKSHSSVISELQAKKFKEVIAEPQVEHTKKPKAFVLKKAKPKVEEAPVEKVEKPEEKKQEPPKPPEKVKLGKIEPKERLKLGKIEIAPLKKPAPAKPAVKSEQKA